MEPGIQVVSRPRPEDLAHVHALIREETLARTGLGEDRDLGVEARREDELVGACYGGTWGGTCELESLWVHPDLRRSGLGTRLLAAAESEAARRGCHQVVLLSHWIQAPGYYEHRGYEIVGRVEEYPAGSDAIWYRKRLRPQLGSRRERDEAPIRQLRMGLAASRDHPLEMGPSDAAE